jgi:hypothetical protein
MESRQRRRKPASGALVLATQFLDPLWPIFVLTGIERVTISPGITRASPLNFEFYPYSHSLLAACPWSLIAGGIYFFARRSKTAAWGSPASWRVTGCSTLSRIVPTSRCTRGGDEDRAGTLEFLSGDDLGRSRFTSRRTPDLHAYNQAARSDGEYRIAGLHFVFANGMPGAIFGPPPPIVKALALTSLSIWVTVAWAAWVDAHRELREKACTAAGANTPLDKVIHNQSCSLALYSEKSSPKECGNVRKSPRAFYNHLR